MDDKDAYMQLALDNVQGELSSLEMGIHALETSSKKVLWGINLTNYAEQIGKTQPYITSCIQGATVYKHVLGLNITSITQDMDVMLNNKRKHLASIYKTSQTVWGIMVLEMLFREWSAQETDNQVKKVKALVELVPVCHETYSPFIHPPGTAPAGPARRFVACPAACP